MMKEGQAKAMDPRSVFLSTLYRGPGSKREDPPTHPPTHPLLVCVFLPFLGRLAFYIIFLSKIGRSVDYQGHCTVALVIEDLPKR